MIKRLVLLNGPPRCGKDTAAAFITTRFPGTARAFKMAQPIRDAFVGTFHIKHEDIRHYLEEHKDEPFFDGVTVREWMIRFSEEFMKPVLGETVFGHLLIERMTGPAVSASVGVISDCGFQSEVIPLINRFGSKNIMLVGISRPGCSFDNDSRQALVPSSEMSVRYIHNEFDHTLFREQVLRAVTSFIEGE